MARNDQQVNIRMPAELKAAIDEAALKSGRSLNSELLHRLQASLEAQPDTAAALRDLRVHLELQNDLVWGFLQQALAMLDGGGTKAQAKAMLEHVNQLITKKESLTSAQAFDQAYAPLAAPAVRKRANKKA